MATIYRDFRPSNFSEILGQNHIKITLQNEISSNNLSHSYLFCGPRAVGKTTTARILAKSVNCLNKKDNEFEPCDKCDNCISIKKGNNLDVLEIDAASNTGVDNVRENIISFSRLSPNSGKYKVFIIDEVHMLSVQAFNALLKIMEEPPAYVIFILCTTEIHKVPGTIISRCERFDFKKISFSETVTKLKHIASSQNIDIDLEVLESIAKKSGGYMRDAESLLGQVLSIGGKKISREQAELIIPASNDREALELLKHLVKKDSASAIKLVNNLADSGVNLKTYSSEVINILRKIMIDKASPGLSDSLGLDMGENLEKEIAILIPQIKEDFLIIILKEFIQINSDNRNYTISQLPFEILIADLCNNYNSSSIHNMSDKRTSGTSTAAIRKEVPNNSAPQLSTKVIEKNDVVEIEKKVVESSNIKIADMSCQEVLAKWPEVLVKVKNHNHSLSFVLQSCKPQRIENGSIFLSFKYKFHQNRVNESDIRSIVRNVLSEVYGEGLDFITEIDENLSLSPNTVVSIEADNSGGNEVAESKENVETKKDSAGGTLGSLLNAFGGEVIN